MPTTAETRHVLPTAFYRKDRLGYPLDFRKVSDFALAEAPARAGTFRGRDKPFELTRPLMLSRRRIWVVGLLPSALLPPGPARQESMLLERHFSLVGEQRFRGIVVTLWLRWAAKSSADFPRPGVENPHCYRIARYPGSATVSSGKH